ncbi:MAG: hypothetical protein J0H09_12560 [Burkholderiales bacterium]|nr:hypothetical protein [Burkholderiales bacterium]
MNLPRRTPDEVDRIRAGLARVALLDIREMREYRQCHLPGCTPLPRGDLESRVGRLVPDAAIPIILCGADDLRDELAAGTLRALGYSDVSVLGGGIAAWQRDQREVATGWGYEGKLLGEQLAAAEAIPSVDVDEVATAIGDSRVLLLDSRTEAEFLKGHLPGAAWAPPFANVALAADLCGRYERVFVNCAGRTRSLLMTRLLRAMGHGNVFAVENGTWAWVHAGHKLERGPGLRLPEPSSASVAAAQALFHDRARSIGIGLIAAGDLAAALHGAAGYIVDIRDVEQFRRGHIPGAFHVEGSVLQFLAEERFAVRCLPITVVGQGDADAIAAASLLRELGYGAQVLSGGQPAWQAAGSACAYGSETWDEPQAAAQELAGIAAWHGTWQEAAAAGRVIVDVRPLGEFALGHLAGSLNLPLGLLEMQAQARLQGHACLVVADGDARKAHRGAVRLRHLGVDAIALGTDVNALGAALQEGVDGAEASLDDAKADVDPFRRRGALRQSAQESREYLAWEQALAHGTAPAR